MKCNLCGSKNFRLINHRLFENNLCQCNQCGLVFVKFQPCWEEIKKIYQKNYFKSSYSCLYGYQDYLSDKGNIIRTAVRRLKKIESFLGRRGRLLDLGCATGFFLEAAQKRGWDVSGLEISDYAAGLARKSLGRKIIQNTLSEASFPVQYFDVITAWDYLEHISDPKGEIKKASSLLKKGGLFVLSTPDISSLPAKLAGDKWMGFKPLEHLYYFSKGNALVLCQGAGLRPIKAEYIGKYVNLDFFIQRLGLYSKILAKGLKNLMPKRALNKSIYINPRDILCLWARKD